MRCVPGILWVVACAPTVEEAPVDPEVELEEQRQVVPGPGLPVEAELQPANNNLDVTRHDGRVYLAFRTAPTHFASPETRMHVVSSEDELTWRWEGTFHRDRDLREPQLVSTDGGLWLYFAELGTSAIDFEPGGTYRARLESPGVWTEPEAFGPEGLIAWRIKQMDGAWHLLGYTGGEGVYDVDADPVRIHWWRSDDGVDFEPFAGDGVVLEGGGSETDVVFQDDGSLVAIVRNEAGDETGFGSKVCTAPADDLTDWTCAHDVRKYDSPLLLRSGGRVWIIGRRTLGNDGAYDLQQSDLTLEAQYWANQGAYWVTPKRCAVWTLDPQTRSVTWQADLPSKGDTCFPEALEDGEDRWVVYNYSSDPEGPDVSWVEGQGGPTGIYRQVVTLR